MDIETMAKNLSAPVKRAILSAPFNSRGFGIHGGYLAIYNVGNEHMGGVPLFIRKPGKNYSGDYSLTELGLAVREYLEKQNG